MLCFCCISAKATRICIAFHTDIRIPFGIHLKYNGCVCLKSKGLCSVRKVRHLALFSLRCCLTHGYCFAYNVAYNVVVAHGTILYLYGFIAIVPCSFLSKHFRI